MHGETFRPLPDSLETACLPDDVRVLHDALLEIQGGGNLTLDMKGNATGYRFLTAYCAQKEGLHVVLDGSPRMHERPIGQLVEALRFLDADIRYLDKEGFPPLEIKGTTLRHSGVTLTEAVSSQFASALLLIGVDITTDEDSPYIEMTRRIKEEIDKGQATKGSSDYQQELFSTERDWSAAAFLLESEALSNEGLNLLQLNDVAIKEDSLQGDKVAVELFKQIKDDTLQEWDFTNCPDLYPAAAVACYKKGLNPHFTGLERLPYKESDRKKSTEENFRRIEQGERPLSFGDHRIAMAFLAAGYPLHTDETYQTEQQENAYDCIAKSYPAFLSDLTGVTRVIAVREAEWRHLTPERFSVEGGLLTIRRSDEGKGKKYALGHAVRLVPTEYVWFNDDDVATDEITIHINEGTAASSPDMIILPLDMSAGNGTLIERMQALEYAAIQSLTIMSAQRGRAVMCSGANLIVRKESWLECEQALHPEIPSGDDMFLLEAMKRRGMRIEASEKPSATVQPCHNIQSLLRQRMRWAGKAPHYSDRDIRLAGAAVITSNILALLCPIWLLAKWILDTRLIATRTKLTAKDRLITLLLTIIYPLYMLICLVGGLFRKNW